MFAPLPFREIWVLDFEFEAPDGERQRPVCMVAVELRSGLTLKLWRDNLEQLRLHPPFDTGPGNLFVAFYASADLGCFLTLGWPVPTNILDLFAEFRLQTNGLELAMGSGLVGACFRHGIPMMSSDEKGGNRSLILRGGPWTDEERDRILLYCAADVDATRSLVEAMLPQILTSPGGAVPALGRALLRGRYMGVVAAMEFRGVPVDLPMLERLRLRWHPIRQRLITQIDADYGIYEGASFRSAKFSDYLARNRIPWPRHPNGPLDLSRDTFRQQAKAYPQIAPLHELRVSLGELRLNTLAVGADGRNRCLLSPFRARTGRNQPSNSKFIFGPATWIRHLITPGPGRAIIAADYSAQEIAIAAALSGDPALVAGYASGDPYLAFAKLAGLVPVDATKASHAAERDRCKAVVLGTNYGMAAPGLAMRLGIPTHEAAHLLRLHREAYPVFWRWIDQNQQQFDLTRRITTCLGWQMHATDNWKATMLMNWPMQAHGAEILRVACILLNDAGLMLLAPIHDAVLVECDAAEADEVGGVVAGIMRRAAAEVLATTLEMRVDTKIIRPGERYSDPRGVRMWNVVRELLDGIEAEGGQICPEGRTSLAGV
jgi:DNA polymerase I